MPAITTRADSLVVGDSFRASGQCYTVARVASIPGRWRSMIVVETTTSHKGTAIRRGQDAKPVVWRFAADHELESCGQSQPEER